MIELEKFLTEAYTPYHAAHLGAEQLRAAGFADIDGGEKSEVGYYRVCGGALFALRKGGKELISVLSHTDSPSLRIRYGGGEPSLTLDVEKYGGGLLRSYLDRKLKIAGRAVVRRGDSFETRLVCSDFCVVVPSLAVHLGGGAEGELTLSRDLKPLLGNCADLYAALGAEDAVDGDLYCVPAESPYYSGANGEYLTAPRIDNLVSVHASLRAITECRNKATCFIACYNSEETGSETREGAEGELGEEFLRDALAAIGRKETPRSLLRDSFALSCDAAHALHPSRLDKYSAGAPETGKGVAIKRNDRYATDALTASVTAEIFARAGLETQTYFHHPDLRCGSTIGLTAAHGLGAYVCDIGVPQLAMHSAAETAATSDINALSVGLTEFFNSSVKAEKGVITIK